MPYYSLSQQNALNDLSANAKAAGVNLGGELESIRQSLGNANLSIAAKPWDVDVLAGKPIDAAGAAVTDGANLNLAEDVSSHSVLNFGYFAGQIWVPGTGYVTVAKSTIALSPSSTNYVEVSAAGAVSKNTVGFTVGRCPLFVVVTGTSSITSARPMRSLLRAEPANGITGSLLSSAQATKYAADHLDTSVSVDVRILAPNAAWVLTGVWLVPDGSVSASDSTYYTLTGANKSSDGTGTTALLDTNSANTTKATGGTAIAVDVRKSYVLHTNPANLAGNAHDLLKFSFTKTSTPADFKGKLICEFSVAG